jgi:membrane-associated phospholipid phosphatase
MAVAICVLVASTVVAYLLGGGAGSPFDDHPEPTLFPAALVLPLGGALAQQRTAAEIAFATWSAAHPDRDDAAFVSFALSQIPSPPDSAQRTRELAELRVLAAGRTSRYVETSTWLEQYGKSEIWKVYCQQYAQVRPHDVGAAAQDELKDTRTLTKAITAAAQKKFGLDSPYIADPSLRTDKHIQPGTHNLSYPSRHAVEAFSALTLLSDLEPLRRAEFSDMADQVAYSRLYMAGHYRSDLIAGAFLGYLIGDYEVAHQKPANVARGPS